MNNPSKNNYFNFFFQTDSKSLAKQQFLSANFSSNITATFGRIAKALMIVSLAFLICATTTTSLLAKSSDLLLPENNFQLQSNSISFVTQTPFRLNADLIASALSPANRSYNYSIANRATGSVVSTLTVTNTNNSGAGSLRQAIIDANSNPDVSSIIFNIAGAAPYTINLSSGLPAVSTTMTIDGTTQPGFDGAPIIELNGANAANADGFTITANNCIIRGFVINRSRAHGILIFGGNNNTVAGNFIGTNLNGTAVLPVTFSGIFVRGNNNIIGGTTPAERNVISGNAHQSIAIPGSGNQVKGNYIGTNASGTAALGGGGVHIFDGGSNNMVGGSEAGARNVISGNSGSGVVINASESVNATENIVQGNYIGTDASGTAALQNNGDGVVLFGASGNTIGGSGAGQGNIISGNKFSGIVLNNNSTNNQILGNRIGINADGTAAIANLFEGVHLSNSKNNIIGGSAAGQGNLISGNLRSGVGIFGNSANNQVLGNRIGTNAAGTAAVPNGFNGIAVDKSNGNIIGGAIPGARNLMSGNGFNGIHIYNNSANNQVIGNYSGTNADGTAAIPNGHNGIAVDNSNGNIIGGTESGARNVVSGNNQDGIRVGGNLSTGNTIEGNYVGTDTIGSAAISNGVAGGSQNPGVRVGSSANGNVVRGNVVSGNIEGGVSVDNGAFDNTISGNFIGTNPGGTAALPNSLHGLIFQSDAHDNLAQGNLISGNNSTGIIIAGTVNTTRNQLRGNYIGTNAAGTAAIPNNSAGVSINSPGNTVGGTTEGAGNVIVFNRTEGVTVSTGTGNAILSNSIHSNGGLGIALQNNGNNNQAAPTISSASVDSNNNALVTGQLTSAPNANFNIQFFSNAICDPSGSGEGQTFIGSTFVTTDSSGSAAFSFAATAQLGRIITATATDSANNTSRFSQCGAVNQPSSGICSTTPISYGQTVNGIFSAPDCLTFGSYTDNYTFSGNAGDLIAISSSAVSLSPGSVILSLFSPTGSGIGAGSRLPVQGFYTLPVTGIYRISASANNPIDSPNSTGTYTVSLSKLSCTYTLSGSNTTISAIGVQNNTVNVVRGNQGCPFVAVSNVPWISVSSTNNGNNNGTINYSVAENTTTSARSGTISIGNQNFTVNQQAPVTCVSNAPALNHIAFGQTITSTLSSDSCQTNTLFSDLVTFSAEAGDRISLGLNAAFFPSLELISPQGAVLESANGSTVSQSLRLPQSEGFFTIPATGTYTVRVSSNFLGGAGDYSLSLYKAPPLSSPCGYSLSPSLLNVPSGGGSFFFDVVTQNGCPPAQISASTSSFYSIISTNGGRVSFTVKPNNGAIDRQATITVDGQTFTINQYGAVPPTNDLFAAAAGLPGNDASVTGFNTSATAEPSEPLHAASNPSKSVWYKWTAPAAAGLYSFSTTGSSFDTVMAIYSCPSIGDCSLADITPVGSNDDTTNFDKTSKVNIRAAAGVTYYIAVDGKNGEDGTIQLAFQQYERLYRLYLQTYNGDPSPIIPDTVVATNGSKTAEAKRISQGVFEFNLPADKTVYRVNISGPAGIVWDPNNIALDDSFSILDQPFEDTAATPDQPQDGEGGGGQNVVSNATNATPRFITGFIKNITGQELPQLSVKIGFSQGPNPRDAVACATVNSPIGAVAFVTYQCMTQPNSLHQIIPNMFGKGFTQPIKFFPFPINNDEFGLPPNALIASNAATYNLSGRVLEGGADTTVDLTYTPIGTTQVIGLRTTTDNDGFYEFKNLAPNAYAVKATRPGFAFNQVSSVNLQANTTVNISSQTVCTYTPSAALNTIAAAGGASQFTITTNNPTCEWFSGTSASWIVINSGSAVGNGTVHITIEANTGASRTGTVFVGGQAVSINQAAAGGKGRRRSRVF